MRTPRLDYTELVVALKEHNEGEANELLQELIPRLEDYLQVTMDAFEEDAEECVQQVMADAYEKILEGKVENEKYIFSYLIQACRNRYIRHMKTKHRFNSPQEDRLEHLSTPAEQLDNLMDEDRQRILGECLDELGEDTRKFIEYFIDKPDVSTKEASKYFNLTGANVRTKKSRLISRLHHCFKRKWNK